MLEGMEYFLEKFQPTLLIEILNNTIVKGSKRDIKKLIIFLVLTKHLNLKKSLK